MARESWWERRKIAIWGYALTLIRDSECGSQRAAEQVLNPKICRARLKRINSTTLQIVWRSTSSVCIVLGSTLVIKSIWLTMVNPRCRYIQIANKNLWYLLLKILRRLTIPLSFHSIEVCQCKMRWDTNSLIWSDSAQSPWKRSEAHKHSIEWNLRGLNKIMLLQIKHKYNNL
jgi:hypothetical protein